MSVINSVPLIAAGDDGYKISRSVRLRSSASAYFNRTPASAGNRKTWTWSGWVKRGALSASANYSLFVAGSSTPRDDLRFSNDTIQLFFNDASSANIVTTQVFRDPSSWYHLIVAVDTTQATASNRVKVYVNGSQVTAFSTATYPSQNYDTFFNWTSAPSYLGSRNGADYFDGYLTEVNFIDGQALTPSSFGETDAVTGVWKPKKYAGTYGTNGFYLNFSDNSAATAAAIGKDYSGNGNNWTPNNISVTAGITYDSMLDTPTPYADGGNGRGNYCTLNPLDWNGTAFTLSNANLTWTSTTTANGSTRGTMGMTTGKWYWEVTATSVGSGTAGVGIAKDGSTQFGFGQALYGSNLGNKYIDGVNTSYGATWATNNVIGVAYDADAGQITFYKDNVSQGAITLSGYAGVNVCPAVADGSSLGFTLNANFGQRPFAYTPPTGFKALNTQNLPDATIKKGNQYFDATTYTGNGSALTVTNSGSMQPDLLWTKQRSSTAWHYLQDAVRGVNKALFSNATDAEYSISPTTTTLNSNGFSFNGGESGLNANGQTYVAWQWKAGGTAVSNTSGSITSQVSANVAAGFSIVTWTGTGAANATVGHGLGVAPKLYIMKKRNGTGALPVAYTIVDGSLDFMYLNTTSAAGNASQPAPTSSVINVQSASGDNELNAQLVAYLFAEVAGFSKFGSYTGNGSADGPFVYCGFRPRFVMFKRTDSTGGWIVYDSARDTYNYTRNRLYPYLSAAEDSGADYFDFLSNGFKVRDTDIWCNASGGTYIYAAFAENPFKNSLAR